MSTLAMPAVGQGASPDVYVPSASRFTIEDSRAGVPEFLLLDTPLRIKLGALADGLHRELALCLRGSTAGDSARATAFAMPLPRFSGPLATAFEHCPEDTVALWHNHPWRVEVPAEPRERPVARPRRSPISAPGDLCKLSSRDVETVIALRYPFAVIAVDRDTWCWWSLRQVEQMARSGHVPGRPLRGQTSRTMP